MSRSSCPALCFRAAGARDIPTSHADLLPTMLGLAGIDHNEALKRVAADHTEARPSGGTRPLGLIRGTAEPKVRPRLLHHRRRDQRGKREVGQPIPALGAQDGDVRERRPAEPHRDRRREGRH